MNLLKRKSYNLSTKEILVFVLFLLIIYIPIAEYGLGISKTYENTENRIKASFPEITLSNLEDFPKEYDNYYNDNHNFRGELLVLNSFFKRNVLNISPVSDITEGKDGWLFRTKYIEPYINSRLFNNIELDSFALIFNERSDWLQRKGIKQYFVIVPNKAQIYPEYLPDDTKIINSISKTDQFIEAIDTINNIDVIYLKKIFLSEKENPSFDYDLYYKTDQHWNEYGALVGMKEIIDNIRIDFPDVRKVNLENFKIDTSYVEGMDLAKTILQHNNVKELKLEVKSKTPKLSMYVNIVKYNVPVEFPYKSIYQQYFKTNNDSLPKILVIRDSFSSTLKWKLPESFSESTFIWDTWCYELNKPIVENEKPDIFVTIIIESNLPYIIYKHPFVREDKVDVLEKQKKIM